MPRRAEPSRVTSLHVLLFLLAIAAVIVDAPSRWTNPGVLRHAEWDGVFAADLVTPLLLFFAGVAITSSRRAPAATTLFAIAIGLIAAGIAVNGLWRADVPTWRLTGVLQRAGVTVAIGAVANIAATGDDRRRVALLGSIAGFITVAHMLVMAHVPPPGGVPGDLSQAGNLAAWVDRAVLGAHAWSARWDPDGIVSTIASTSTVLVGMAAGIVATSRWRGARTMLQLVGAGAGVMLLGIVATVLVPINRSLWSASFVLLSAGVATILLAALVWSQRR